MTASLRFIRKRNVAYVRLDDLTALFEDARAAVEAVGDDPQLLTALQNIILTIYARAK